MKLSFLLFLLFSFQTLFAQQRTRLDKPTSVLNNTIIIKLKEGNTQKIKETLINLAKPAFKDVSITQMFPSVVHPKERKNKAGQKLTDIANIYRVKYSAGKQMDSAIQLFEQTGLIEYAEPSRLYTAFYLPNDPAVADNTQFYLERYQASEAWDICKGDTNTIIGIVDTGVRFNHEDLKGNVKYNWAEKNGIAGVDDDGDGYIDNSTGWDLGDNDNNPDATGNEHGTAVAGCAAASTDNGMGIAGTCFNCKYLPVKATPDSLNDIISQGWAGLIYAVEHGAKVINLSWGGTNGFSQYEQDIINYAVINKDVVVVAAAGNSGKNENYYPASYKNVLSVAASDTVYSPSAGKFVDGKADFATYTYRADICAQGRWVYSTRNNGGYATGVGSSFSSPQVAGAAALVRSKHPGLTAIQVMEQLRVTADIVDTFPETKLYKGKYGRRLNMYKALVDTLKPGVRVSSSNFFTSKGSEVFSGDTIQIVLNFINYLHATTNCQVSISSESPYIRFIDSTTSIGAINTFGTANNNSHPFIAVLGNNIPEDYVLPLRIQYNDVNYYDYEHFTKIVNPAYLTLDTNAVALTITSNGRLGFKDKNSTIGEGFVFQNKQLLFEAGLMLGINDSTVSDCVRGNPVGTVDVDFASISHVSYTNPLFATERASSVFTDTSISNPIGIKVAQNSMAWKNAPNDKFVIVEYLITNTGNKKLDSLNVGIFADWDIMNSDMNRADYNADNKLGYVYSTETGGLYAGISLLTKEKPSYFALDHLYGGGGNINPNDGFPSSEKFAAMNSGILHKQAGTIGTGSDVSHVVGAILYNLAPGESQKVAFAFIGGTNLASLQASAIAAKTEYKSFNTAATPNTATLIFCPGDTVNVLIKPAPGTAFNFYTKTGTLLYSGSEFSLPQQTTPDTIYIAGIDSIFESPLSKTIIRFASNTSADFTFSPNPLDLSVGNTVSFTSNGSGIVSYNWDFGDNTNATEQNPVHLYTFENKYPVTLYVTDSQSCKISKTDTLIVLNSITTGFANKTSSIFKIYPVPSSDFLTIEYTGTETIKDISIINTLGEAVFKIKTLKKGDAAKLDIQTLPKGVFYLKYRINDKVEIKSFIKQ